MDKTKTKKKKKLNSYTEKKNEGPPVKVEEAKITELPETTTIVPVKEFAMPIANPEQLKKGMELYQQCVNALVKSKDIVMVEGKPHGKKIAVNKINRVFGVSTEVLRSFLEEYIAHRDHWSKGFRKTILVHKGETYTVAKAWVKAILPNGQYCTRGGAVSETERRFAHFPHDLMATAETRAMKNAAENLLGIEFEMVEEESGKQPASGQTQTPRKAPAKATEEKPKKAWDGKVPKMPTQGKSYNPKPNEEQGYKHGKVASPKLPATPKQKELINMMIEKIKNDYETETNLEKPVEKLNKGEASNLISKLLKKGKELKKKREEKI